TFEMPDKNLAADKSILETVKAGGSTLKLAVADNSNYELYDWPGAYAQRYDGVAPGGGDQASKLQKIFQDNARTVGIRMEQEALPSVIIEGTGNCRHFSSGYKFTLATNANDKQAACQKAEGQYVLTAINHFAKQNTYRGDSADFEYQNSF